VTLDGAELNAIWVFGFGYAIAQEHEAGVEGQDERDGVKGGVADEADGYVTIEDRGDGTVFEDEEGRDVAAVDEFELAALFVVECHEGDVLLAGDAGTEERVDVGDGVDEGDLTPGLGVHHALDDGGEQGSGHTFAGDIGDDGDEAVFYRDDVVEVAAYLGAGDGLGHDFGVGIGGEVAGDDAPLNGGGDLHLVADEVCGALGLDQAGIFDEVSCLSRDGVEDVAADAVEGAGAEAAVEIEEAEEAVRVAAAQGYGDDAAELVGDDALPAERLAFAANVADEVLLARLGCVADDGVGDLGIVEDSLAFVVEGTLENEGGGAIAEEDEAALGTGEAQGVLDHVAEDVFEHTGAVEALCGLEEEGELLELGSGDHGRHAVKECPSGGRVLRGDEEEGDAGCAELDTIAGVEAGGVRSGVIDEGPVAAAEILNEEAFRVFVNGGVLAGDLRVGEIEIRIGLAADGKGQGINGYGSRLVCFTNYQADCMFDGLHNGVGPIRYSFQVASAKWKWMQSTIGPRLPAWTGWTAGGPVPLRGKFLCDSIPVSSEWLLRRV
jgi:hypothetical protein